MLSCKEVAERASAMIDGELAVRDTIQMRLHLAMCKGCGRFMDQMRVSRDLTMVDPASSDLDEADNRRIGAIFSELHKGKRDGG